MADLTRAEFDDAASADDFLELAKQPRLKVLQCSEPVRDDTWRLVNEHFCPARPDVALRVYRHGATEIDLGFARLLSDVRHFAVDGLGRATGVESLAEMRCLESLSLGIFELTDFSVLEQMPTGMTSLSLGATRSKKPSLAPVGRFRSLRVLHIDGHSNDIETLDRLPELEHVSLRSIATPDLRYLSNLPRLWYLDIKLGGIWNFSGIDGKASIKHLELCRVRELRSVDIVAALPGLQSLLVTSLPHIQRFPLVADSKLLRRIVVNNLKGLRDFSSLAAAPALEDFALLDGRNQTPQQLLPVLDNLHVRRVSASFGSDRKNSEFCRLRGERGKAAFDLPEPFDYH